LVGLSYESLLRDVLDTCHCVNFFGIELSLTPDTREAFLFRFHQGFFSHFSDVDEVAIIHKVVSSNFGKNKIEKFFKLSILHMFCNMLKLNRVIWQLFEIWPLENQRNTHF